MDVRIYTKDGKTETLQGIQSITDASGAYYLSFLDGTSLKVYKSRVGAIQIKHEDSTSQMRDEF